MNEDEVIYTQKDLDDAIEKARADEQAKIDAILAEVENEANFYYTDSYDLRNKAYERGFFDAIHNLRAKLKAIK